MGSHGDYEDETGDAEGQELLIERLRNALAVQSDVIDQTVAERQDESSLAALHRQRLDAANEYIAYLERRVAKLEARLQ